MKVIKQNNNHYIIATKVGAVLQSYNTLVAFVGEDWDGESDTRHHIALGDDWDYSTTTAKNVAEFVSGQVGERLTAGDLRKALKAGELTTWTRWTVANCCEEYLDGITELGAE